MKFLTDLFDAFSGAEAERVAQQAVIGEQGFFALRSLLNASQLMPSSQMSIGAKQTVALDTCKINTNSSVGNLPDEWHEEKSAILQSLNSSSAKHETHELDDAHRLRNMDLETVIQSQMKSKRTKRQVRRSRKTRKYSKTPKIVSIQYKARNVPVLNTRTIGQNLKIFGRWIK